MGFDDLVSAHVAPYSLRGQDNKRGYLRRWATWCETEGIDPLSVTRTDLDKYRGHLVAGDLTPRSVNAVLTVLRSFSAWMVEEGHWSSNPAIYLRRLPVPAQVVLPWLTDEQTAAFLCHVDREADAVMRGLVYVLAYYGSRPLETRMLDEGDIDGNAESIEFRVRKDGRRSCYELVPEVADALEPLLTGCPRSPLFVNQNTGMRLSKCIAQKRFNDLVEGAGVPRITMYGLRASFATNSFEAGVSERSIQDAMGHSNASQTALYDQARGARASEAQKAVANRIRRISVG